jgi:hypothetical protein
MTRVRRLSSFRLGLTVTSVMLAASTAIAQDPAPSPEPPRIDVLGFVDVYYAYNFNKTNPAFRSFDVQHNAFSLSYSEIDFTKAVSPDSRLSPRRAAPRSIATSSRRT